MNENEFIINWNDKFPLDRWWRNKYKVSFNSKKHRNTSYYDIFIEWLEENMFAEYIKHSSKEIARDRMYEQEKDWFLQIEDKEQEKGLINQFDNLDLSKFDELDY